MAHPVEPIRDGELAGAYARKFFGKFGVARLKCLNAKSVKRSWDSYEVGVMSPEGDFLAKGVSAHDYAEAFQNAGRFIDDNDQIYLQHTAKSLSRELEARPEQVEMFG